MPVSEQSLEGEARAVEGGQPGHPWRQARGRNGREVAGKGLTTQVLGSVLDFQVKGHVSVLLHCCGKGNVGN